MILGSHNTSMYKPYLHIKRTYVTRVVEGKLEVKRKSCVVPRSFVSSVDQSLVECLLHAYECAQVRELVESAGQPPAY